MARNTIKTYQKFKGINQKDSPLISNMSEFSNCQNYIFNGGANLDAANPDNVSLISRVGHQQLTQSCSPIDLIRYSYGSEASGVISSNDEILVFGHHLFRVEDRSFVITRTPASVDIRYEMRVNSGGLFYEFVLFEDDVAVYTETFVSDGREIGTIPALTVYDLATNIDALANYSVNLSSAFPKFAKVNGNQPTASVSLTVDAGHTIVAGDNITLYSYDGAEGLYSVLVTSVGATTLNIIRPVQSLGTFSVLDNQYINEAAVPATCIPVAVSENQDASVSNTITITYKYLTPVGYSFKSDRAQIGTYGTSYSFEDVSVYNNKSSYSNQRDCLFFLSPNKYLLKYDGLNVYRSGLPTPVVTLAQINPASGGSIEAGTYTYAAYYSYVDNRGNIIESPIQYSLKYDPDEVDERYTLKTQSSFTATPTAAGDVVYISFLNFRNRVLSTEPDFNIKGGIVSTGVVGGNTIILNSALGVGLTNFIIGDKITFKNEASPDYPSPASITTRNVTSITFATGSVTFDGTPVTITVGARVTSQLTLKLFRTNLTGNVFYLANEYIVDVVTLSASETLQDGVSNSNLGIRLVEEISGKERARPPQINIITEHQGGLVGARGSAVRHSIPQEPEYWPVENEVEFPYEGIVTGLYSDTDDRLIVFKERAIYKIEGDLDTGNFDAPSIREGDFGVSSHNSLAKCNGVIYGLGRMGFIGLSNGQLLINSEGDSLVGSYINPEVRRLINGENFSSAMGHNNPLEGSYQCWIPNEEAPVRFDTNPITSGGTMYVFDYLNGGSWLKRTTNDYTSSPYGRTIVVGEDSYFASKYFTDPASGLVSGQIYRRLYYFEKTNTPISYKYIDHVAPIRRKIKTKDEHLGIPSTLKEFLWFKVFSMFPITDFNLEVTTYLSFVGHSYGDPTFTLSFSSDPTDLDRFHDYHKLSLNKAFAIAFEIDSNIVFTCPIVSGLELVVSPSYEEEEPYS